MLKKLINFAVIRLKNRPFEISDEISNLDLFYLLVSNGFCLLRGLVKYRKPVLLGMNVSLKGKSKLFIHPGVSIGGHVLLDGIGKLGITIGQGSSIGAFSVLKVSGSLMKLGLGIHIGKNVGIGEFAHIGGAGGVSIGDDTIIGSYFSVHPEEHIYADCQRLIREQGVTHKGIEIGNGCWIGAKVTILDGAKIGNGCVVAAGAVVKGSFPDNCVLGGVPAKVIKCR